MRRIILTTAAVAAAVVFFLLATLPPAPAAVDPATFDPELARRIVPGAYHIHTTRSDGAEDKASVAAAAARAGLKFAIFTDHGDATRAPDPPAYVGGVLCLDGVEISTNDGHYVALDLPAAPYPLGGAAATVVEDVARLGGFGIAAHPDSRKPDLAWTDWDAPIDGLEWVNVDSEWRDETTTRLARALADYLVRPAPAIASILDRPSATLDRWARLSRERRVVALAALDAHGGVHRRLEGGGRFGAGPSYDASFRTMSNRVLLDRPLSGDAAADAKAILGAIRQGRVYSAIDAIAAPAVLDPAAPASSWRLPPGGRIVPGGPDAEAGWVELQLDGAPGNPPIPWVLTNPIAAPPARPRHAVEPFAVSSPVTPEWRIEKDPASQGLVRVAERLVTVEYSLAAGGRASQFVALAGDLDAGTPGEQVVFTAEASRPMRVSVQLRFPTSERRWVSSAYVDSTPRTVVVPIRGMRPAERDAGPMPDPSTARSLLFVVDLTNAAPGFVGSFRISNVRLARPR